MKLSMFEERKVCLRLFAVRRFSTFRIDMNFCNVLSYFMRNFFMVATLLYISALVVYYSIVSQPVTSRVRIHTA